MDPHDLTRERIRTWRERIPSHVRMPLWWDWAVLAAQYHLVDCDWVTVGVAGSHCTCGLSRMLETVLDDPRETGTKQP